MNSCRVCLFAKEIKSIHGWWVCEGMCNEGSWNFFLFPLPEKQLCKTTSLFENTLVGHLHGLGKYKCQFQHKCEVFMTFICCWWEYRCYRYCTVCCLCLKCQWGLAVICEAFRIGPYERRKSYWGYCFSELLSLHNKCELAWEKCLCLLMTVLWYIIKQQDAALAVSCLLKTTVLTDLDIYTGFIPTQLMTNTSGCCYSL